jgi:hypothetical protein
VGGLKNIPVGCVFEKRTGWVDQNKKYPKKSQTLKMRILWSFEEKRPHKLALWGEAPSAFSFPVAKPKTMRRDLQFLRPLLETRNMTFKQNCHLDRGSVVERSAVSSILTDSKFLMRARAVWLASKATPFIRHIGTGSHCPIGFCRAT